MSENGLNFEKLRMDPRRKGTSSTEGDEKVHFSFGNVVEESELWENSSQAK